ncbi:hypothetical protein AAA294_07335 [Fusobacterium varium]|uniref:hypothetical protein n=1 Tax=Fusobacterium varium TaxID=856 RepID=UPI0032C14886
MEKDEDWDLETTLLTTALPGYERFIVQILLTDKLKNNPENENIYKEYIELNKKYNALIEKYKAGIKAEITKLFEDILGI